MQKNFNEKFIGYKWLILGILLLAFLLRFWAAGNYDLFGDEAVDAFRGVGYIDFLGTSFQTQPIDWYKNAALPWWTSLSFHDFPPLTMIIQHLFFTLFGDSILTARLPAIFLGTLATYLIFLIVRKLFTRTDLALWAAFLFASNSVMVWIFRTSLLEPVLLFSILLNIYAFFRFLEDKELWWFFGVTLGLVALTKYVGIFLLPFYFVYLILVWLFDLQERWESSSLRLFKDWRFYSALALAALLFSPVIIYNVYLYRATGHFDLQIAYLLGQETPEWTLLIGKTQSPFINILKNFTSRLEDGGTFYPVVSYQIPFLLAVLGGLIYSIFRFKRALNRQEQKGILFFWLYIVFYSLLLLAIGSAHRFLAIYGPAFIFFAALLVWRLWELQNLKKFLAYAAKALVSAWLIWEVFYAVDKNFFKMPDFGMAKLDHYFENEFRGLKSAVIPNSDNPHLDAVINRFVEKNRNRGGERQKNLIIFNDNVVLPTLSWTFYRRFFYQSWPTLYIENFYKAVSIEGEDYFAGFNVYFVQSTRNTLLNKMKLDKTIGEEFESQLTAKGLVPAETIYGHNNLPMFRIYKYKI